MSLPSAVIGVLVAMSLTFTRATMLTKLKTCKIFGGPNPNEWFGAWVADSTLGGLLPVLVGIAATGKGRVLWGILIGYNCIGAFDYANGALCQFLSPQADGQFPAAAIFASMGIGCFCNLVATCLLFTEAAMNHYTVSEVEYETGTLGLAILIPCVLVVVVGAAAITVRRAKRNVTTAEAEAEGMNVQAVSERSQASGATGI